MVLADVVLNSVIDRYPNNRNKVVQYGTAGFRTKAEDLKHVMFRMGLLAALRSRVTSAAIGVMITASHNPEPDNGVKLVDPHGEMLASDWELIATQLANVSDNQVEESLKSIVERFQIDTSKNALVFIGRDTRASSAGLAGAVAAGVEALQGIVKDFAVVTTPMLHYFVTCHNTEGVYGRPTQEGYFNKLATAFKALRGDININGNYKPILEFDGANGVGALKMAEFLHHLGDSLQVNLHNSDTTTSGKLNFQCGADYVKTKQGPATGVPLQPFARCASVDGDADRLVYYFVDDKNDFHLLDGDRIASLVASYIKELLEGSGLAHEVAVVQTAYANGSSTEYITHSLKVPVSCVATGVKHLHKKAVTFDIGVYFEANGHGTVVFSQNFKQHVQEAIVDDVLNEEQNAAARKMLLVIDVVNETVGDAISDLLLVETVLHARGWDLRDWLDTYTDLPNRLAKVMVKDRNVITTTDAERRCVTPPTLQAEIDRLVAQYPKGRAFVRASGTEDVVRVYAEAETEADTNALALQVAQAVHRLAGGVGDSPSL